MFTALMTSALFAPPADLGTGEGSLHDQAGELRPVVRAVIACVLPERADHADVEDCTSEAMRRALEPSARPRGPLRPWLLGVARHVALDALRARQRQRARTAALPDEAPSSTAAVVDRLADPSAGAEEQLEAAERAARVRRVLMTLPEGPRKALEAFHLEGLSYQEISRRLGVPLGTVATWVTRGRKTMAEALEDDIERARQAKAGGKT